MRISVTIPAYNAAEYIEETLDSLLGQTRRPDEVIVCDDGSTDDTAARAEAHSIAPKVLRRENGGVSRARNDAIEAATGDLIANIDSDDLWHEQFLAKMEATLVAHPEAPAAFCNYAPFTDEETPRASNDSKDVLNTEIVPMDLHDFLEHDRSGKPVLPSFLVARRTALGHLGARPYCDEHHCGENLMVFPMLFVVGPMLYLPARLGRYRMHGGSITGDEIESSRWMVRVAGEMIDRAQQLGFSQEQMQELQKYAGLWSRHAGRRLGGGGFKAEGRRAFMEAYRQGHENKSLGLLLASWVPGLGSRVWRGRWRPESAQKPPQS